MESDFYKAINSAEFRDGTPQEKQWIRTRVIPKRGSSAFGPIQITRDKAIDYMSRGFLSPEASSTVEQMTPMWNKMLKVGNTPLAGEYDYGKSGNFPVQLRPSYISLGEEMLSHDLDNSGGNYIKATESWRGKSSREDKPYYSALVKKLMELKENTYPFKNIHD